MPCHAEQSDVSGWKQRYLGSANDKYHLDENEWSVSSQGDTITTHVFTGGSIQEWKICDFVVWFDWKDLVLRRPMEHADISKCSHVLGQPYTALD